MRVSTWLQSSDSCSLLVALLASTDCFDSQVLAQLMAATDIPQILTQLMLFTVLPPPPTAQFVAKRYKKPVDRTVYFADVVLQMDAKFLGEQSLLFFLFFGVSSGRWLAVCFSGFLLSAQKSNGFHIVIADGRQALGPARSYPCQSRC